MLYERVSNLVSDNRILHCFYDESKPLTTRILCVTLLFFVLPLILIIISALDRILFLEGEHIGMLEDYLFLASTFIAAPLSLVLLRVVINRFIHFVNDLPSFSNITQTDHQKLREKAYKLVTVTSQTGTVSFIKYLFGIIALASNTYYISMREGGWNSFEHLPELIITFIHMVITICIIVPNILIKYLLIVWAEVKLTQQLAQEKAIIVRPLAPDKSGGLKSLGDLSLSFTYFLLPFVIVGLTHYFTWRQLTVGIALGTAVFIPLCIFVFFVPLIAVHKAMSEAKQEVMHYLSEKHLGIYQSFIHDIQEGEGDDQIHFNKELLEVLDNMYNKANNMPVWPFNIKIIVRFITVMLAPLCIIFLEVFVKLVFEKFFQ